MQKLFKIQSGQVYILERVESEELRNDSIRSFEAALSRRGLTISLSPNPSRVRAAPSIRAVPAYGVGSMSMAVGTCGLGTVICGASNGLKPIITG